MSLASAGRPGRPRHEIEAHLRQHGDSGLSLLALGQQQHLPYPTLWRWRCRLAAIHGPLPTPPHGFDAPPRPPRARPSSPSRSPPLAPRLTPPGMQALPEPRPSPQRTLPARIRDSPYKRQLSMP